MLQDGGFDCKNYRILLLYWMKMFRAAQQQCLPLSHRHFTETQAPQNAIAHGGCNRQPKYAVPYRVEIPLRSSFLTTRLETEGGAPRATETLHTSEAVYNHIP